MEIPEDLAMLAFQVIILRAAVITDWPGDETAQCRHKLICSFSRPKNRTGFFYKKASLNFFNEAVISFDKDKLYVSAGPIIMRPAFI
jgi:hypothetical protein